MRILIAGAGMAGLTLAALLKQRGTEPTVVDRAPDFSHAGYMLNLWPLGSRVLHGLGAFDRFVEVSRAMQFYQVCNGRGEVIHAYELQPLAERFGYVGQLMRGELLDLLRAAAAEVPLRMKTSVESLHQEGDEVSARLSDGSVERYDLVVGADGIHSKVRERVFGSVPMHATGWSCRVWTTAELPGPADTVTEYWGAARLVGVYPVRGKVGIVAAGPTDAIAGDGSRDALVAAFAGMGAPPREVVATAPKADNGTYLWKLDDLRCERWYRGRVALCGDSACAFLPTAGVGASMAMESAAVLADELSRTDAKFVPRALELYEKRRKKRAEGAQDDSRHLAGMMMVELAPLAWGRDQLLKFYSLEMLAKNLAKSLDEPF